MVAAVCAETGDSYTTRDVDADPELVRQYTDQVPVTFVDGPQHDFWRVDPVRLRAALARPRPTAVRGTTPSDPPPDLNVLFDAADPARTDRGRVSVDLPALDDRPRRSPARVSPPRPGWSR